EGHVEVHQRRHLHLLIDISLGDGEEDSGMQDQSLMLFPEVTDTRPALKDARRIRLEQLHYFDQPRFGVIAIISRYEPPEPAESETETQPGDEQA
ncbi:MAG: CsiV family protein, partial [Gammaproteobacteria bacterium]